MARLKIYNDTTDTWEYVSTPNGLASASDIDAGTDTSKSLTPAAVADSFIGGKDGWVKLPACSYYSATQISFAPGVFPVNGPNAGAKIKLTNASTVKYFIVTSVGTDGGGNTVLALDGMNGATVENSAITLPYYSLMANPRLWPDTGGAWSNSTCTLAVSGGTAPTYSTNSWRTWTMGKTVIATLRLSNVSGGTNGSGTGALTVSLPYTAKVGTRIGHGSAYNNAIAISGKAIANFEVVSASGGSTAYLGLDGGDNVIGNNQSNANRYIYATVTYERE